MGTPFCELWIKARDAAGVKALAAAGYEVDRAGVWVRAWERDAESDRMGSLGYDSLGPEEPRAHGEVVYLAMGDGPEGSTSGMFLYEHFVDGRVRRALAFAAGPDETFGWQRVEGKPEPWEATFAGPIVQGERQPCFAEDVLFRAVFDGVLTARAE